MIDLSNLHNHAVEKIILDEVIEYSSEEIQNIDLIDLPFVHFQGEIFQNATLEDVIKGTIEGKMILQDAITLEPQEYPFSIEIDEILKDFDQNIQNTLDLKEFLWENIVLEIPLKFTKVEDLSKFHGDGWKVISEEEEKLSSNPFSELLNHYNDHKE